MTKLFVANWKMNGSIQHISDDLTSYVQIKHTNQPNVILALPDVYLSQANAIIKQHAAHFQLASQDNSQFNGYGAYTGEVSVRMQQEFNIKFGLVGHSERRVLCNEDNSIILKKMNNLLLHCVIPIFCIGENKQSRNDNTHINYLSQQLDILKHIHASCKEIIIAYEPIWAIGTGIMPNALQITEIIHLIQTFIRTHLFHVKIQILYGGSVCEQSGQSILNIPHIDGVLVGGASLEVSAFANICKY